jgi:hypothetical protein
MGLDFYVFPTGTGSGGDSLPVYTVTAAGTASSGLGPYGSGTPGTKSNGVNEAITAAFNAGGGTVNMTLPSGTSWPLLVPVVLMPGVNLIANNSWQGSGGNLQAAASGFVGSYVLTSTSAAASFLLRSSIGGFGVDTNGNNIDGVHLFGHQFCWINIIDFAGGGTGTAFYSDGVNCTTSANHIAGNNYWLTGQDSPAWAQCIYVVGSSSTQNTNNLFWHVDFKACSGTGISVYQYADTNTFFWARVNMTGANSIGFYAGGGGTSTTGANCDRIRCNYLDIDIGTGSNVVPVAIGYYTGAGIAGYTPIIPSLRIYELISESGRNCNWIDLRGVAEGGTGAVSDYLIIATEANQPVFCTPAILGVNEQDDNTGDRTAADASPINMIASASGNQVWEIDAFISLSSYNATTGTVSYTATWTDWSGQSNTMALTASAAGKIGARMNRIQVRYGTAVTIQATCSGTWTSTTAHVRCRMRCQSQATGGGTTSNLASSQFLNYQSGLTTASTTLVNAGFANATNGVFTPQGTGIVEITVAASYKISSLAAVGLFKLSFGVICTAANFLGAYNGGTAYVIGNVVTSGGVYYTCISNTTGNAPPNATYWSVSQPANGTTTGTAFGSPVEGVANVAGDYVPIPLIGLKANLVVGSLYWFDVQFDTTAGTLTLAFSSMIMKELPA